MSRFLVPAVAVMMLKSVQCVRIYDTLYSKVRAIIYEWINRQKIKLSIKKF